MYREAAATATPRSTSRASSSICRASSQPSAIVTTATGAAAAAMPNPIALAGPGPEVVVKQRSRGSLSEDLLSPGAVGADEPATPRLLGGVPADPGDGVVVGRVDDDEHLALEPDRLENPVE